MRRVCSFKILVGLFSWFILSFVSFSESQEGYGAKTISPLSNAYIHKILGDARGMQRQISALPTHVFPLVTRSDLNWDHITNKRLSLNLATLVPYIMLEGGLTDWDMVEITLLASFRGNLIFGNLYHSPFYFRCGWDYIPFGYHDSAVITSQNLITRSLLQQKSIMLEIGSNFSGAQGQLQSSFSVFLMRPLLATALANMQYRSSALVSVRGLGAIKHYIIGGGFGIGGKEPTTDKPESIPLGVLLNIYSRIGFSKGYQLRWEFIYNTLFLREPKRNLKSGEIYQCFPHALHVEVVKQLPRIAIAPWVHSALIWGYECGSRPIKKEKYFQSNLFGAFKLAIWKQRILLSFGSQWNLASQDGPESFFRVNLSP